MERIYIKPTTRCPLSEDRTLANRGVELVPTPEQAQWIVVSSLRSTIRFFARFPGKRFLVYTNEPRDSQWTRQRFQPLAFSPAIEVMNVFTGDVFWHNFHFLGSYHFDRKCDLDLDLKSTLPLMVKSSLRPSKGRPVAAIFTNRPKSGISWQRNGRRGENESTRSRFASDLHQAGLCDIYGSGWPPGTSRENSGFIAAPHAPVPWWTRKLQLLAGYRFNLCPENTVADHYCTEKIWHAIQGGTLPIYRGAQTIYRTFPRDSFIDLADFSQPAELADFVRAMPESDYLQRINACREVFNHSIAERRETISGDLPKHAGNILRRLGI